MTAPNSPEPRKPSAHTYHAAYLDRREFRPLVHQFAEHGVRAATLHLAQLAVRRQLVVGHPCTRHNKHWLLIH